MMNLMLLLMLLMPNGKPVHYYHSLQLTASDPYILERCVDLSIIRHKKLAFVKETVDPLSRCIRLEFFEAEGITYEGVGFSPVVQFSWSDTCLVERRLTKKGKLFAPGKGLGANKVEYRLSGGRVVCVKSYYNGKLIDTEPKTNCSLADCVFFLMYSGCTIKIYTPKGVRF
jgi:hypothetical protein